LLKNLRYLRRKIAGNNLAIRRGIDTLVGASITASYLADRGVLNPEHMTDLSGLDTLDSVLIAGKQATQLLFDGLAQRFNGDVFGNVHGELDELDDSTCKLVASLLRGDDLLSGQGALWPYDFKILPPDLVSSVYEQLLADHQKQDAAYYTPRPVVDIVLDEVLAWSRTEVPRVIDLACGSGTFMTEAFRRLVFRAQRRSERRLSYSELKNLLVDHIYGIDKNQTATRVAAFGLYLALLEEVEPKTIWQSVTLPKLIGTNIVEADAFESHPLRDRKFDVVISNPPWKSKMTSAARSFVNSVKQPIADNQLAQAFVWLARDMLAPRGRLGLVLPAKDILHNRSNTMVTFRAALFGELLVRSIVDLSPIRHGLFSEATGPTALLIADRADEDHELDDLDREILHIAVHPRLFSSAAGTLVVAPEDFHVVSARHAVSRPEVWKILVWGSPRDADLIDRLRCRFPSLAEVMQSRGWQKGQGYKLGGSPQKDASELVGLPVVDVRSVLPLKLPAMHADPFGGPTMHRPRRREQYRAPQIVVRRTLPGNRLAATMLLEDAVYSSELNSISGSPEDLAALTGVAMTLCSSIGNYWQFMTSASWGIERTTVELNELLDMPIPVAAFEEGTVVKMWQKLSSADPLTARRLVDEAVFEMFQLRSAEVQRIRDGIVNGLQRFDGGSSYSTIVSALRLNQYLEVLGDSLRRSLPEILISTGTVRDGRYICAWIAFEVFGGNREDIRSSDMTKVVDIDAILRAAAGRHAGATGMLSLPAAFLVDGDTVYIVKTDDADRWSYDAAISDADRIFAALAFGS
jgi:SAM-dependent methyltransferase